MPKNRDILLYINDIYFSCEKILSYTENYDFSRFMKDLKTIDAVVLNLEIIGEASKNIPITYRNKHKEIPWKIIIGMRNKIAHEYFGVDETVLWETIKSDIPFLFKNISEIKAQIKNQSLF
jgi:uncharacterized protein with HEPN domain